METRRLALPERISRTGKDWFEESRPLVEIRFESVNIPTDVILLFAFLSHILTLRICELPYHISAFEMRASCLQREKA